MADLGEIEAALEAIRSEGQQKIVLLHCVSSYPTSAQDVNLRAMDTLKSAFKLPVGFSDHTLGIAASIASVAMGASILEKHFTAGKDLPGPDQKTSLDPSELKEMVDSVRYTEKILGDGIKKPTKEEVETRKTVRKSIVAAFDLPAGTFLQENMLNIKRPGTGIAPKHLQGLLNRRTKIEIKKDELIAWEKME
jgi:N-acetylneuraminate synthase/N,N'-diacetyllegionaminate synthase